MDKTCGTKGLNKTWKDLKGHQQAWIMDVSSDVYEKQMYKLERPLSIMEKKMLISQIYKLHIVNKVWIPKGEVLKPLINHFLLIEKKHLKK